MNENDEECYCGMCDCDICQAECDFDEDNACWNCGNTL